MTIKIFINSNLTANFICPECGKSELKDVSKFIGHKTTVKLKYKCKCKHSFSVILERRRSIRKEVNLKGEILYNSGKYAITIEDISKHGLKIKLSEILPFTKEGNINIRFILDDPNKSNIQTEVKIKKIISPVNIGCEFLSFQHHGNLGKYFLFYY
jgi:hypothetical protein